MNVIKKKLFHYCRYICISKKNVALDLNILYSLFKMQFYRMVLHFLDEYIFQFFIELKILMRV